MMRKSITYPVSFKELACVIYKTVLSTNFRLRGDRKLLGVIDVGFLKLRGRCS